MAWTLKTLDAYIADLEAQLSGQAAAGFKPDYSVDGRSVKHTSSKRELREELEWAYHKRRQLTDATVDAVEIRIDDRPGTVDETQ